MRRLRDAFNGAFGDATGVTEQIRFEDGAAYQRYMGSWSQCAGEVFLDWLAPPSGWRWLDVGCGNGAFTETLVEREALRHLWTGAGLEAVETREIALQRTFADFDDYWATILGGPSVGPQLATLASEGVMLLKMRMRALLPVEANGRITYSARANAVKGCVPG